MMKNTRVISLATLLLAWGCTGDGPTSIHLPKVAPKGTSLHIAASPTDHDELLPIITGPSGALEPGSITLAWGKPTLAGQNNIERYRYEVTCTGNGCTPVAEATTSALTSGGALIASFSVPVTLTTGSYTFTVRGERGEVGGSGNRTLHAPIAATRSFTVSVPTPTDVKAPTVDCEVPNQAIWWNANQTVSCTAYDESGGSGLKNSGDASFTLSTDVASGSETSNATIASRTIEDNAGNVTTIGPFTYKIDRKAPIYSCPVTQDQTIWYGADQSVACTSADGGSGLAFSGDDNFTLSTSVAVGVESANASTGSKVIEDAVGNAATAGPISGFMVDKKGPTLACDQTPFKFLLNQSPATVSASITDGGSGPKLTATSGGANTSSVGLKSATLWGEDNLGNTSQQSCAYTVEYNFGSWGPYLLQPINRPNEKLSSFKLGSTVPAKFVLLDANGTVVQSTVLPTMKIAKLSLTNGDLADGIEQEVVSTSAATVGNNFRWDDTQYIYNISTKTPTGFWATNYLYRVTATIVENGLTMTLTGEFVINK